MHLIYKYAFAYYWLQSKVNIIIDLIANQGYKDTVYFNCNSLFIS